MSRKHQHHRRDQTLNIPAQRTSNQPFATNTSTAPKKTKQKQKQKQKQQGTRKHPGSLNKRMPRAGLIYESTESVFGRKRRDHLVIRALQAAQAPMTRQGIHAALILLVQCAKAVIRGDEDYSTFTLQQVFEPVKAKTAWTRSLTTAVIIELFFRLLAAREAWKKSPRFPEDYARHAVLAIEIDYFVAAVDGTEWLWSEFEIFKSTGGMAAAADTVEGKDVAFKFRESCSFLSHWTIC